MPRYDDDDDRPRKPRRPRDEEDDRPRARRPARDEDDDDDDRPKPKRRSLDDLDDDRPRRKRKAKPPVKKTSPVGIVAVVIGAAALVLSFMPCFASWSLVPAGIGLVVGFVGLLMAHNSNGRQGIGMPTVGLSLSTVAVLIAIGWLVLGKQVEKKLDRMGKEFQAQADKEEAERKGELAKAAADVKAAAAGGSLRVNAPEFAAAYAADDQQADRTYKDKVVEVTGTVHEVDVTGEDEDVYTVQLSAGPNVAVDCEFLKTPENRARLARLKVGDTVTIRGKCLGSSATIEACVVVE